MNSSYELTLGIPGFERNVTIFLFIVLVSSSPAKLARDGVRNIPGAIIVYLESTEEHEVTMAQVSRLFAGGNFLSDPKYDDTYFITTDVDLW